MFVISQRPTCSWSHTSFGRGKRTSNTMLGFYVIEHIATGKCVVDYARNVSAEVDLQIQKLMAGKHNNAHLNKLVSMDMDLKLYEYPALSIANAKDGVRTIKRSMEPVYLLLNP